MSLCSSSAISSSEADTSSRALLLPISTQSPLFYTQYVSAWSMLLFTVLGSLDLSLNRWSNRPMLLLRSSHVSVPMSVFCTRADSFESSCKDQELLKATSQVWTISHWISESIEAAPFQTSFTINKTMCLGCCGFRHHNTRHAVMTS